MNENYFVWGTVSSAIGHDYILDKNGEFVPYTEGQERRQSALISLRRFFADNRLLIVEAFDKQGNLIDREYRFNDFTGAGNILRKRKESAWLNSKGSQKNPPDMKIPEKTLADIL